LLPLILPVAILFFSFKASFSKSSGYPVLENTTTNGRVIARSEGDWHAEKEIEPAGSTQAFDHCI
jgi:hypothetical protein